MLWRLFSQDLTNLGASVRHAGKCKSEEMKPVDVTWTVIGTVPVFVIQHPFCYGPATPAEQASLIEQRFDRVCQTNSVCFGHS